MIGLTRESCCLVVLQGIPGRSKRKMIQAEMAEMISQSFEASARRSQCPSVGVSPNVSVDWTALLHW